MCPPSAGATRLWESANRTPNATPPPDCVPSDPISQAAYKYAAEHLHPSILNHSLRVYLLAHSLSTREKSLYTTTQTHLPLLFTASILHDIGTTAPHAGPQRFEVEGADGAQTLLRSHGVSEADAHHVWTAIALHTSPGIAERISPLARLVRMGVAQDFKRTAALRLAVEREIGDFEARFPRGEVEKVLGDGVVEQVLALEREGKGEESMGVKAPAASWPGILLRSARENPGWEGVNKAF